MYPLVEQPVLQGGHSVRRHLRLPAPPGQPLAAHFARGAVLPAGGGGAARALRAQQRAAGAEPHGDQPAAGSDGCRGRLRSAPVPLPGKKLILTNI